MEDFEHIIAERNAKAKIRREMLGQIVICLLISSPYIFPRNEIIFSYIFVILLLVIIIYITMKNFNISHLYKKIFYCSILLGYCILFLGIINFFIFLHKILRYTFYSFNILGMNHNSNVLIILLIFLISLGILLLKGNYLSKISEDKKDFDIAEYFINNTMKKTTLLMIGFFGISAFFEELLFRGIFAGMLIYYFYWNLTAAILLISLIFGLIHYFNTKNWLHVGSAFISSIIYFIVIIFIGLLYAWILHFTLNLFLIFLERNRRKIQDFHLV